MNAVRVLIIDADENPPLGQYLNTPQAQFRFTRKADLASGLVALRTISFDLVILSLSLRDAPPAESVRQTLETASNLPVIALVNEGDAPKAVDALSLGMMPYVVKGCHCNSLVRTMQYALERQQLILDKEEACREMRQHKDQLTAHLSHELRNALACIHQFGNILADGLAGPLSDEQSQYLGIILENASRINSVLNDLLEADTDSGRESVTKGKSLSRVGD